MILIYTSTEEIPKEILKDMKEHKIQKENQYVFISIPMDPTKEEQEIGKFKLTLNTVRVTSEHTTSTGKRYFISESINLF